MNITFRETAGAPATVTEFRGTITRSPSGLASTGSLATNVPVPALQSITQSYTQSFVVDSTVQAVQWRAAATFVDGTNRVFTAESAQLTIEPPAVTQPPAFGGGSGRLLMFGGRNNQVFLGCISCGRFDSQSIFNAFGDYGSRFSATSIWNGFSDYGSRFSNFSACNQFATQPPIVVDERGNALAEMTINRFRPGAIPGVISWLNEYVCES